MRRVRVLWLCNTPLSGEERSVAGTWLDAMAARLLSAGEVELGVICLGNVRAVTRADVGGVRQWIVPSRVRPRRSGLPAPRILSAILSAVDSFRPELVHVWGTESYWGLLTGRGLIEAPAVLNLQGLMFSIAPVYDGGLTLRERMGCLGLKEIVRLRSIGQMGAAFARWGRFEREMMATHASIICSSAWHRAHVLAAHPSREPYECGIMLRDAFHAATPWRPGPGLQLFCSAAYPAPFKGLHVAVRAVARLRRRFPDLQLRLAGVQPGRGIRRDGYAQWLAREVNRYGLQDNVVWLGSLTADRMVAELQACKAVVIPSFIESVCVAAQEAMLVGAPVVSSYVGGIPSSGGRDEETCLFFPAGDDAMCAAAVQRLLTDEELARSISHRARELALSRNLPGQVAARQAEIYRQVLSEARPER